MKVLVIAHGHPDFSVGGAELAAYNLYAALKDRPEVGEITFLARTDHRVAGAWRDQAETAQRVPVASGHVGLVPAAVVVSERDHTPCFANSFSAKQPDVVFVHHFANIGIEILREFRRTLPQCLHRADAARIYRDLPAQRPDGQEQHQAPLLPGNHRGLQSLLPRAQRAGFLAAQALHPEALRGGRHVHLAVGIPAPALHRMGHPARIHHGDRERSADFSRSPKRANGARRNRFGFFGQVTEYKGVDLLLKRHAHDAAADPKVDAGRNPRRQPREPGKGCAS